MGNGRCIICEGKRPPFAAYLADRALYSRHRYRCRACGQMYVEAKHRGLAERLLRGVEGGAFWVLLLVNLLAVLAKAAKPVASMIAAASVLLWLLLFAAVSFCLWKRGTFREEMKP